MVLNQGLSAASRILPIIDQKNHITDTISAKPLELEKANIEFKKLSFAYDNKEEKVLDNIDLEFLGGKMTSLVGHSGSGKSTILNLIPRFYDAQSGDILIDNQSIYNSTIKSLRSEISLVSQETTLFDDTIKNNIKYANDEATDEEVYEVAKLSYCEDFINNLPNKYETLIGENGIRLSGGEKQRLSIARAMMKKSSIILLDEATSSLDSETESKIQTALKILTKDKTTIVIAHRLSTILNSNNIYVINSGKIIDNGKHEELMANSELYKNFYEKQIQK
jgi:subfamily B ATP-binding cassette protein MsbA